MSTIEKPSLAERLRRAQKELCEGVARQWNGGAALKISIPARPEHDSDLLIGEALRSAEAELDSLRTERLRLAKHCVVVIHEAALQTGVVWCTVCQAKSFSLGKHKLVHRDDCLVAKVELGG